MLATLTPVAALLLSVALLLMGNGLQTTLLPVRAQLETFSTFDIGVLGASYYLGFAAGCLFGPFLVRRAGHIRTFAAMVSLASTVALLHALILDAYVWWPCRATTGLCLAVLFMIIESWLNEMASNENRGFIFSIYVIINLSVVTLGQMMLTLGQPSEFLLFAIASILVSLAALPVAFTSAQPPAPVASVAVRIGKLFEASPVGVVAVFMVGLSNGAFWSLAPLFAQRTPGLSSTEGVAFFMSIAVIAGAIGQWPLGRLSDRMDRRRVILAACIGGLVGGLAMAFVGAQIDGGYFIFAAAFGFFAFPLYALGAAHMNDSVEPGGFVEASSGLLLLFAGGAVIGPIIASFAMAEIGPTGLFLFTAVIHVSLASFTLVRMRMRSARPEEDREAFLDSAQMSQTVGAFDPTGDDDPPPAPQGAPKGAATEGGG